MPTSPSTDLAVLTLSWINEQLLVELDRKLAAESTRTQSFWRRQAQALLSFLVCGVNLISLRTLA